MGAVVAHIAHITQIVQEVEVTLVGVHNADAHERETNRELIRLIHLDHK